ncbi:OLC1v1005184C1 [Oldenlandia corymbosa var. corymbosa]|uniref:OLC1v1005184C1 n=1 Tax=Oldenlandia corymbosa var. corymbosa TaxID=529605 RepID=A0AAV1DG24_OLDCO|nr:OLC1v1005184C1 [Oldenlandia corymbosa var. corymbosa]
MARKWLASAALFVLLLSPPVFHAQGPLPIFSCFINCGVKTVQCSMGCLVNPICYMNCGIGNLRCISYCNETLVVAEDQIPPVFEPKTMAIGRGGPAGIEIGTLEAVAKMISSAGIGENVVKESIEAMAKIIASVDTSKNGIKGSLEAIAKITSSGGSADNRVKGSLHFLQDSTERTTRIKGRIVGLSPGIHGLSIHSTGSCDSIRPHFNPFNWDHGAPLDTNHHTGHLGNIVAGPDGIAEVSIKTATIQLNGLNSILGRPIVVRAEADGQGRGAHEDTKINGNSGGALGCGIIEIKPSF